MWKSGPLALNPSVGGIAAAAWQQIPIGAGGFLTGHSIAADGTMGVRIDVFGAYLWNPNGVALNGTLGRWEQLITPQSMPSNFLAQSIQNASGVFEICIAYNNSSVIYMTYLSDDNASGGGPFGSIYKSTNKGQTWSLTGFTPLSYGFSGAQLAPNGQYRIYSNRIGIDFNNTNNVLFGSEQNGLFISQDGGATWFNFPSASVPQNLGVISSGSYNSSTGVVTLTMSSSFVAGVGISVIGLNITGSGTDLFVLSNNNTTISGTSGLTVQFQIGAGKNITSITGGQLSAGGATGVFFDPTNSNKAYAFVNGSGLYVSSNINLGSSATWSLTTGGPTTCIRSDIDLHNGTYYSVDSALSTLSKYASGTWSTALTQTGGNQIAGVACDPNLADHIMVIDGFTNLNEGTSGSFGGWSGSGGSVHPLYSGTNDAVWLAILTPFIGPDGILFDRTVPRKLYVNTNNGFLTYTAPGAITTSTTVLWNSQSRGIEDLVGNAVLPIPGTSTLMMSAWDYGIWNKQTNQLNVYETTFGPIPTPGLAACWSLDFAKNNVSVMAALTDGNYAGGTGALGYYSTDGGNTWTAWLTAPVGHGSCGNIAVSTPSNIMWGIIGGVLPFYTTNGNVASPTWTQISLPGTPNVSTFLQNNAEFGEPNPIMLIADSVTLNTFYMIVPNVGTYFSTNSGATWSAGDTTTNIFGFTGDMKMKPTPGIAADYWVSYGITGLGGGGLYHTSNGGVSYTDFSSVISPCYCMGFGAAKPGGSGYPAIFATGYWTTSATSSSTAIGTGSKTFAVSAALPQIVVGRNVTVYNGTSNNSMTGIVTSYVGTTLVVNVIATQGSGSFTAWKVGVYGIWQSDDEALTWSLVGGSQYVNNTLDSIKDVSGDLSIYGQVYVAMGGSGFAAFVP